MRIIRSTTCALAIATALAHLPARADTTIDSETSDPILTSIDGDIIITDGGILAIDSGVAITVDSDNDVTIEGLDEDDSTVVVGEINVGDADDAIAILVETGTNANISNVGTITVLEDFVSEDEDANAIADGPIASASNRYGIYVAGGGTASGSIDNSGIITVEGLNSGGIVVDSAYDGSITNTGTITVIGDNSYGIKVQDVSEDVTVRGNVQVAGEGSVAFSSQGDIDGALTFQGAVRQLSSYTNDDSVTTALSRTDLRSGAAAVEISGNVGGGIMVAIAPDDDDEDNDDEDGDGIEDTLEGTGYIASTGNGPAMLIGGAADTVIGTVADSDDGYSLVIDGSIVSSAGYSSTDSFGLVIGGQGGSVDVAGGIELNGTLSATSYDSAATALLINEDSVVDRIAVTGSLSANLTSTGEGEVYAIRDLSGSLTSIDNSGFITTSASSEDIRQAIAASSNTTGLTIIQYLNDEDAETKADIEAELEDGETDDTIYTAIIGDIVTGSGNDLISASAGIITGDTYFNAGNDTLTLSDDAVYTGDVYFGTGTGLMTLFGESAFVGDIDGAGQSVLVTLNDSAVYTGTVQNGSGVSVVVNGGTFGIGAAETSTFDSLTVGADGSLGVYIDGEEGTSSLYDVNSATFESGAKIATTISSLEQADGTYVVLTASEITGTPDFDSATTELPFIFAGETSLSGNDLVLDIRRKEAEELGLSGAGTSAYDAIITASAADETLATSFLQIEDAETLQNQVDQFLPDHSGGIFDFATRGSRLAALHITDDSSLYDVSDVGGWIEPIFWGNDKDAGDAASYKTSGWGVSMGLERWSKIGNLGLSYAYTSGEIENNDGTGIVDASQHELGAFWRMDSGPLYAFSRISASYLSLSSTRTLTATADDTEYSASTTADWNGWMLSGAGGVSYDLDVGSRLTFRPKATFDYYRLHEGSYDETGGGDSLNLYVDGRTSDSLTAATTVAAVYRLGSKRKDFTPLTFELEGGRRHHLAGSLGTTTASFLDGEEFSLTADGLDSSWLGEARILAGGLDFTWQLSARAEKTEDDVGYSARASLSLAF
ncbi:autotransporter outer membrane beta-barrel domain-containing protein [Sphingorhabdus sp. 109]|uniref:autotransporter outer membrane beta-barrel domain-containing protein n=1 Tax=Sphingorhabdus sp. 109 TaxID=2653173 RepID=UPI0012F0571D|nr:autotransporter domain-containing protein [Sphingorhabdus sp. 109]VWX56083.1 Autotransporter beta-domain-containing protein [Sphingorhabdus sp. 109]